MVKVKAYACVLRDADALYNSSSGGAFTALSNVILSEGGVIACSVYDVADKTLRFELIESAERRDAARGSKYFQSEPGRIYADCIRWLRDHPEKRLMFVGTGCQTEAFRRILEVTARDCRPRVILTDLICQGISSPKLWKEYMTALEKKRGETAVRLTFRDKRKGWLDTASFVDFPSGEVSVQPYFRVYSTRCMFRDSCYRCPFSKAERDTDLTIGDAWGIDKTHPEFMDDRGVSLVLCHTEEGEALLLQAQEQMRVLRLNEDEYMQNRLRSPAPRADFTEKFWKKYQKKGTEAAIRYYGEITPAYRVRRKIRNILQTLKIKKGQ